MTDFVSDNPYRLLGLRSDTLQSSLKLLAAEYDRRKGLNRGEEFDLGATGTENNPPTRTALSPTVDLMGGDPALRTAYRLLWPLAYATALDADQDELDLDFDRLEAEASTLPGIYAAQLRFLKNWDQFHEQSNGSNLPEAFAHFQVFAEDLATLDLLTGLLLKEGVDYGEADTAVRAARVRVEESLLSVSVDIAEGCWNAGDVQDSVSIIEAVTKSPFAAAATTSAVQSLAKIGRSEEIALTSTTARCVDLLIQKSPLRGLYLWRMSNLLKGRITDADRWAATYEKAVEAIVTSSILASTDIAFLSNEPQVAIAMLENLAAQPLPPYLIERVTTYLPELRKNAAKGPTNDGEFKPIKRAPIMWLINGMGTRVADEKPCPERPGWNWVTYYGVLFFVSIFPIRRYLVKTVSKGRWYFYASAPLEPKVQKVSRIGCGAICAVLIGLAVLAALVANTTTSSVPTESYSMTAPPDDADRAQALVREHDDLARVLDAAIGPIKRQTAILTERKEALESERAKINPKDAVAIKASDAAIAQFEIDSAKFDQTVDEYNKKIVRIQSLEKQIQSLKASP